jgi:cytochrome c oxidase cbb3-type subunit 3
MRGACLIVLALVVGCEREARRFDAPPSETQPSIEQMGTLHAGPAVASAKSTDTTNAGAAAVKPPSQTHPQSNRYEENAYAVAQGKRFYRWYNCNGCHAAGGGDKGPALMDEKWLYGHQPAQIVASILQGRPNGMPSFAGRIPEDQAWQIAAYVRSMSGQLRSDVAPSRSDSLSAGKPEQQREQEKPELAPPPKEP